ncbi:MAG: hypothetical protein WD038_08065, partial [Balneolales bacterium]
MNILEEGPDRGVIHVKRDWHKVVLETTFTLKRGENTMNIRTEMTNKGVATFENILSGYVLWADGGYLYDRPGIGDLQPGSAADALTSWTSSYDEDWALAFHAPFAGHTGYDGQDQYKRHTLGPEETISFEGWLQVVPDGELSPVVEFEAERQNTIMGSLSGKVQTIDGETVKDPILMVHRDDHPYVWAVGNKGSYEFKLPEGEYSISAMAENYSTSSAFNIQVQAEETLELNFDDLNKPGKVVFDITGEQTGNNIDAKLEVIEGQTYPVQYMGRKTFFTNLDFSEEVAFELAPGEYTFKIGSGEGFISTAIEEKLVIKSGEVITKSISLPYTFTPQQTNWYSADLHHHTDVLDGSTPTKNV